MDGSRLRGPHEVPAILPAAFDAVAAGYDAAFTDTLLGRLLRDRVWQVLERLVTSGQRVLELGCGTGEDACWLAQQGAHVVATDGSREMLAAAQAKARQRRAGEGIAFRALPLQALAGNAAAECVGQVDFPEAEAPQHGIAVLRQQAPFDAILSNFGVLNAIGEWEALAAALAPHVRPGGWALLVVMGPLSPWEIGLGLLHGSPGRAFRRLRATPSRPAPATIGEQTIPVWYPSPRRLARSFSPWFHVRETHSLGLFLPPSELAPLVERYPRFFGVLNQLERTTARLTGGWGDHYIVLFERTSAGWDERDASAVKRERRSR